MFGVLIGARMTTSGITCGLIHFLRINGYQE